jgi:hypothetical protein
MLKFVLASLLIGATAFAGGTPQNHHCKLTDGSFDGTKTNKQCTTAKGTWEKDADFNGTLTTGVVAIGGETTGITLDANELDLHGDKDLTKAADGLNGKAVAVTGYLTTKKGVEIKERHIIVVSTLKAGAAKPAAPVTPKK